MARTWEIVSRSDGGITPQHRSPADFERLYSGVGADNYIWYQGRVSERVFAIFASEGLDSVPKVKDALPREASEKLASDTLLERLENIRPEFKAWAASLAGP